jgi:HEAT repeat protein
MADQDEGRVAALLQLRLRWAPDPAAPGLYLPESAAPGLRLRADDRPGGRRYTLLIDGVAVRVFDALPAGWVVDPAYDPVAAALAALRDGDPAIRRQAAWQLAALGDRRALPALERMALADQGSVRVERGFVDDDEPIYPDAVEALRALYARLGLTPAELAARLTALLHEPAEHPNGSQHVLALGGAALRPALRAALASPEPRVVIRAAMTLAALREPGAGLAQLAHPDPGVRLAAVDVGEPAAWGATWVGWPPAAWRDAVLARLPVEPEPAVRRRLVAYITQYCKDDSGAMLAVLRQGRRDPDAGVRQGAAARLHWFRWREFGPALPELAGEALAWAQAEPVPRIQRSLLWSAPLLPAPGAAGWLVAQLAAGDRLTRRAAAARLAEAEPALAADPLLQAADSPDDELRWTALEALAKLGEARALPKFERELAGGRLRGPAQRAALTAVYRRLTHPTGEG